MTITRRSFLKGLAGTIAAAAAPGLILPPEPEKRFFPLDRTMLHRPGDPYAEDLGPFIHVMELDFQDTYFLNVVRPGDVISVTDADGMTRIARVNAIGTDKRNVYLDWGRGLNG